MCGIAGYLLSRPTFSVAPLIQMNRLIAHRGPDDEGFVCILPEEKILQHLSGDQSCDWAQRNYNSILNAKIPHKIGMGHRRYSIIDLSPAGHQPMQKDSVIFTFNGEIYNYIELKQELTNLGHVFTTNTDTEVAIEAYKQWGTESFSKFNGFFSIVLYDIEKQCLVIARDRIGKAPLYIYHDTTMFCWSSEIKSILDFNESIRTKLNFQSVSQYVNQGVRDYKNQTFWDPITTFPAAHFALIDLQCKISIHQYWDFPTTRFKKSEISFTDAKNTFHEKLRNALHIRLRSDIPIGFTLSGGLDSSSLIGLLLSENSKQSIDCIHVKYSNKLWDESKYAVAVANRFCDKIDLQMVDGDRIEFTNEFDSFIHLIEEPFLSPNLYSDFFVQKKLKSMGYGVMINGAGGDELLAGYESEYFQAYLQYLLRNDKPGMCRELANPFSISPYLRRLKFIASTICPSLIQKRYQNAPVNFLTTDKGNPVTIPQSFDSLMHENFTSLRMNYWMRSGNKSYMGVPMEPRLPFLDYTVIEFCFKLPIEYLINNGWHKYILRKTVDSILPKEVTWRKRKMGFPFDLSRWLLENRKYLIANITGSNCPFVNVEKFLEKFGELSISLPHYAWRYVSLLLWYKRMVLKETISRSCE